MTDDWQIQQFDFTEIDYDPNKNYSNWKKHGLTFEEAARIFANPVIARCEIVAQEERWVAVGYGGNRCIAVIFCERGEVLRIISARAATAAERRRHGQDCVQGPAQTR